MTRIAILDETLPSQIAENPGDFEGLSVVWAGTQAQELARRLGELDPHVIVCSLDLLGDTPSDTLARFESTTGAELVLLLYQFARRDDLRVLEGDKRRVVQAPLSVARLRSQMMGVVVRQLLGGSDDAGSGDVLPQAIAKPMPVPKLGPNQSRRFTRAQLGRLAEISTSIDCECPHHLSQLVTSLVAFEEYSDRCKNRDDKDAAMHRLLYEETGKARAIMEEALVALMKHERIVL